MPFFIRKASKSKSTAKAKKKNTGSLKKGGSRKTSSKKADETRFPGESGGVAADYGDEEIDSDEADGTHEDGQNEGVKRPASDSESDHETAQDKRLRLAKLYLEEIKRQEEDGAAGDVDSRLRDEVLERSGRLQKPVAARLLPPDTKQAMRLRYRRQRLCVTCVAVSSDETRLFSGSKDACIVKWNLETGRRCGLVLPNVSKHPNPDGHKAAVLCITLSSDDKFLVSGDAAFLIHVRCADSLSQLHVFRGHRGAVTGVAFQRGSHQLFSVSSDRVVKVWSVDDRAYIESLFGHADCIGGVDALSRERAVTCGGSDNTVRVWKLLDESQLVFTGRGSNICCVRLINDSHFVTGGEDGVLSLWSAGKKRPLCVIWRAHGVEPVSGVARWICCVAALLNSDVVASGSHDDCVRVWRCCDQFAALKPLFVVPAPGFVNALHVGPTRLVVACGQEHRLGRWWRHSGAANITLSLPLTITD